MVTIHLAIVICTVLVVLYADEQGFEWVRGKKEVVHRRTLDVLHAATGIGLSLIILTGGLMFLDRSTYLLNNTYFLVKMVFVLALVINSFAIGAFAGHASERSFASLSPFERRRLLAHGAISTIGWAGAITCGLLLG